MAGHYPLPRNEEQKLFSLVDSLLTKIVGSGSVLRPFSVFLIKQGKKEYRITKLSPDYVENAENEIAYLVGPVSIESITDEHPSLTKDIQVEVHISKKGKKPSVTNIFWVA
jgi:hypothetical protein